MKTRRADRLKNINSYSHWVYGLYLNGKLCYVGVTADPAQRVMNHMEKKDFDEIRLVKGFSSREKAEEFEKFSILYFNPALNVVKLEPEKKTLTGKIPLRDLDRFENDSDAADFDFALLTNKSIERRHVYFGRKENGTTR